MVDIAEAAEFVNGERTRNSQAGIGHNGGPEIDVQVVKKLAAIEQVLKDKRYSQTQALILIGLIVKSDSDYSNAFPGASTLAVYAKVTKRHTVFDALNALENVHKVIKREARGWGRSNSYAVLPQAVMNSVIEEYTKRKTSADERHVLDEKLVPEDGTAPKPARAAERKTSAADRHATSAADRHTTLPLPSNIPILTKSPTAAAHAAEYPLDAYQAERVVINPDGSVQLLNGLRAKWVELFGGDEASLDAALLGIHVQKNSHTPVETQVSRQLKFARPPSPGHEQKTAKDQRKANNRRVMNAIANLKVES